MGRPPKPEPDSNWKIAKTQWPAVVDFADPIALAEWDRLEPYLVALDRVASIDRQALASLCVHWAKFNKLAKDHFSNPSEALSTDGPSCEVVHPLLHALLRSARGVMKLSGLFGMTARTRDLESDHGNRKSSALKRLMGNQRKVAKDKLKGSIIPMLPDWDEADMRPPEWMNARALEEFNKLGEDLKTLDLFTPLDLRPLVIVSVLFDLFLRAGEQLSDPYTYTTKKVDGEEWRYEKEHPLHKIQWDIGEVMHMIWKDYGQTPRYRKVFNGERPASKKPLPMMIKGKVG